MESIIIALLSKGYTQYQISIYLQKENISPHSLSSVEKIIKRMKSRYKVDTNFQLGVKLANLNIV